MNIRKKQKDKLRPPPLTREKKEKKWHRVVWGLSIKILFGVHLSFFFIYFRV